MKYAYYPGCSSHSTAPDMHQSCLAVAEALGIELVEIPGWTCCGATATHQTDPNLAAALPAANLARARDMGLDMVTTCAACYNRSKMANFEVKNMPRVQKQVEEALGRDYDGSTRVRHFVEVLPEDPGIEKLKQKMTRSLSGLKVACYYGCYLVRPPEVTGFDDPENPMILDRLIEAMGGQALDWPGKVDCCGGSLNLTRTDATVKLSARVIGMAEDASADLIAVACPMCQTSLDLRQKDMEKATGRRFGMPVIYFTQLIGLCLGIPAAKLGLDRLVVSPVKVLKAIGGAKG